MVASSEAGHDSFEENSGGDEGSSRVPNVSSLGQALAGMSLTTSQGEATSDNSFFPHGGASSQDTSGWGSFPDSSDTAFGSGGANSQRDLSKDSRNDTVEQRNSLELFLSRDPSQTLGENALLKLNSQGNLSGLADTGTVEENNDNTASLRFNNGYHHHHLGHGPNKTLSANPRRTAESPASVAATGTTTSSSRTDSPPYHGHAIHDPVDNALNSHTIQAFQAFASPNLNDGATVASEYFESTNNIHDVIPSNSPAYHLQGNNMPLSSPYSKINSSAATPTVNNILAYPPPPPTLYESPFMTSAATALSEPLMPTQGQQILYMAVPSADGRGQVLQPVQMVQLPGSKQMAYVMAGPAGAQPDLYAGNNFLSSSPTDLRNNNALTTGSRGGGGGASLVSGGYGGDILPRSPYNENRSSMPAATDDYALANTVGSNATTDPAIASLYASPQRPPLDALLGQVRRLSRDQVGCRLVQQALDEEGPMAASLILQEGLSFWGEAMVDPFGNYLFQKILEKVSAEERVLLVKSVSTRLVNASLNLHGTRSVQKVVELCAADETAGVQSEGESAADILTQALTPAAARLCIDSHGNHVIQRIILKLGPKHAEFVFDAVAASVGDVARHRHGCCVIQRCLDSPPSEARSHLVRCIVDKALELMQDAYGNYVVQYVLDVCSDDDVHSVCESVVGKVNLLAIQKFSSNVMEKCLERCSERVKECYMAEMSDPERIRELMMDPFGNYVVQRALSVATHAQAIRLVEAMRPHLVATTTTSGNMRNGGVRNTAGGRRIIAKICRRFPNFLLTPPGSEPQQGPQDFYRRGGAHGQFPHVQQPISHGGHHHHHDELYSRNKNRYHHQQLQQPLPLQHQQHSLSNPSAFAVGPPVQQQEQLWSAPEQNQRGYGASPDLLPSTETVSYYNSLAGPSYYDAFGGLGGGFHGAL